MPPDEEHEEFVRRIAPNDAGSDHFWGWSQYDGMMFWAHRCTHHGNSPEPIMVLGTIDYSPTGGHELISREPVHIEPSILCSDCQDHGFLRDGRWEPA